jgi:hypothetical protein
MESLPSWTAVFSKASQNFVSVFFFFFLLLFFNSFFPIYSLVVSWEGYEQYDDSWEPWGFVAHLDIFYMFCNENEVRGLIPLGYRLHTMVHGSVGVHELNALYGGMDVLGRRNGCDIRMDGVGGRCVVLVSEEGIVKGSKICLYCDHQSWFGPTLADGDDAYSYCDNDVYVSVRNYNAVSGLGYGVLCNDAFDDDGNNAKLSLVQDADGNYAMWVVAGYDIEAGEVEICISYGHSYWFGLDGFFDMHGDVGFDWYDRCAEYYR